MNQFEKLEHIAEGIRSDIEGDHPGFGDTDYDLWVEELRLSGVKWTIGVIDMGDMYQGVYVWRDGKTWEQDMSFGDPQDLIDKIIRQRKG
jgi:hypothetical protein